MNTKYSIQLFLAFWILPCLLVRAQEETVNRPPVIKHDPVTIAVRNQPISIRAVVSDDSGIVKSVTLFCSTSKDAAPFKFPMQASGAGSYVGTIPANLLSGANQVSYYIEALDNLDAASESPWYKVKLESPQSINQAGRQPVAGEQPVRTPKPSSWKKPAWIAGGTAALVGGAALAISASQGGSSHGGGGSATTNTGTYVGTVTTFLEISGSPPTYSSYPVTFTVVSDGIVSSDTLYAGQHLEARLSGIDFTMVATVSETNMTGQIRYLGTVVSGRITGSVEGAVTTLSGSSGSYSGTFSATKQ